MAYRMGACSHKQIINIFCMILAFTVIIYEVLKILLEKWPKLWLIEAILGYLVLPHKQRLKAVQVNFICYYARGHTLRVEFHCSTRGCQSSHSG